MTRPPNRGDEPMQQRTKSHSWLPLIVGSVVLIALFHLFPLLNFAPPGLQENRVLASAPSVPRTMAEWSELPRRLDAFAIDNFAMRPYLISVLNLVRYKLGYSGSKRVVVGQDGWLFFDNDTHLGIVAGELRAPATEVANWARGFEQRRAYLQRRNAEFFILVAPVKEDIFPEHRPSWMPRERVTTEIDDFLGALSPEDRARVADPRDTIIARKHEAILYDQFDTHWTGLGAYLGYQALMEIISRRYPDMTALPASAFTPTPLAPNRMQRDLALMLGISNFIKQDRVSYATIPENDPARTEFLGPRTDWTAPQIMHTESKGGRTLLLLRDSFSSELVPLLKPHFSRIISVHVQDGFFREDLVEKYRPDVVALVMIETGMRFSMDLKPALAQSISPLP